MLADTRQIDFSESSRTSLICNDCLNVARISVASSEILMIIIYVLLPCDTHSFTFCILVKW